MQESKTVQAPSVHQKATWDDLRVFYYVVETGSLTGAARVLGLTQPTVSRRIEELEQRLKARLLIRGPGGVTPTEAGLSVHDHVRTMERSADSIERLIDSQERTDGGRVGLAVPDGVGAYFLMPVVAAFQRENPGVLLTLDCGLWPDSPLNGHTDVALQYDEDRQADTVSSTVATVHYVLAASRDYLDTYGTPTTLADVAGGRYIHHSAQKRQPDTWGRKTDALQGLADPAVATNSSAVMVQAILHGAGIGPLPTALFADHPDLVMLDFPPIAQPKLWVRHHVDGLRSPRVRRVVDWLHSVFDPRTHPWFRAELVPPSEFQIPSPARISAARR